MLVSGQYSCIVADPPWNFRTFSNKGRDRSPDARHYSVMSIEDIKKMPVRDCAAKDCALFLWVTDPNLLEGLDVIKSWGFTYKTVAFTWAKTTKRSTDSNKIWHMGLGYWTRANPESCLLATRGRPERLSRSVRQLIVAKVREHSRKPDEFYTRVEQLVPGPYLELFSRQNRPGWTAWGNQTGIYDHGHSPT